MAAIMERAALRETAGAYLDYLDDWMERLQPLPLEELLAEAGGPEHIGLFCVDVINGFCHEGPLSSDRVKGIIAPIARLFTLAYEAGIRHFVLPQDTHDTDAAEFAAYPPHCVRNTSESRTVPELAELPFAHLFTVLPKNSVHSAIWTGLDAWLDAHPEVTHRIVFGDCTDICTFHLALHLKTRANAANRLDPVILPADCVDTYDVPMETARQLGIPPHPGDIFHAVFLHSMFLNGIRVVSRME